MARNLIEVVNKAREELIKLGADNKLIAEIDEALKTPEIRIATPKGDMVAGCWQADAQQVFVYLDNKDLGEVDLFLAETQDEALRASSGVKEGDIIMRIWDDIGDECYTNSFTITAEEIDKQVELVKEENIER